MSTAAPPHRLRQAVLAVGREAWLWRVIFGLSIATVATVAAAVAVGGADYWLRSEELGLRLLAAATVLAVGGWACVRFLGPSLIAPVSALEVAQRIEQRFPEFHDRLSSALEFLAQDENDPLAGSAPLRRAVVAETETLAEQLPLREALDRTLPLRWAAGAGAALLVLAVLFACDPTGVSRAAQRLVQPWAAEPWPRVHTLEFIAAPTVHPAGRDLELTLVDRSGALPQQVEVQYRFADETRFRRQKYESLLGDRLTFTLPRVAQRVEYRAVGGDHTSMPLAVVEVIHPPEITRLQITLTPPPYARLPVAQATGRLRALAGTTAQLTGEFSAPVARVDFVAEQGEQKLRVPLALDAARQAFSWPSDRPPLALTASGYYTFEIVDPRLTGPADPVFPATRYEISVAPDQLPSVVLDQPSGHAVVTPGATIPIRVTAGDDLGLRSVTLLWNRAGEQAATAIELYAGPADPPPRGAALPAGEFPPRETRILTHSWELGRLADLTPGTTLELRARAEDYRPGAYESEPRRITVITADELVDRLELRQAQLLGQLAEALRIERQSRLHVAALDVQLTEAQSLGREDLNRLQSAELAQRDVAQLLAGGEEGVLGQLREMLAEIAANRLDRPELARRLTQLRDELQQLAEEPLPAIAQALVAALKGAQETLAESPPAEPSPPRQERLAREVGQPLALALAGQDRVIATLERLLGELTQWDNYRRFAREVGQVRGEQRDLVQRTSGLRQALLARPASDLTQREQADLKAAALAQRELSRRLERLAAQMEAARTELQERDPLAAETLADALDTLRRKNVGGAMRTSADRVERNQTAQGLAAQEEALAGLQETLDALSGRREHELERLVQKLKEAAGELEALRTEQESLKRQADAARQQPDAQRQRDELQRLMNHERALREKIDRLARRLERLQAAEAAEALQQAGDAAAQAADAANQGEAERQDRALDQAGQELAAAEQKLKQAIQKAEQDLLDQQLTRLEQAIGDLATRQQAMVAEIDRLSGLQSAAGELTKPELLALRDAARAQRGLQAEAAAFAEKIAAAQVFHAGLQGAIREMERAAEALDSRELGPEARQPAELALAKLHLLREALQARHKSGEMPPQPAGEEGGKPADGPPQDGISTLAELKLLKLLQESVLARTRQLAEAPRPLTPAQQRELAALAAEQGALSELIVNLTRPKEAAPEDAPDKLPDPRAGAPPTGDLEKRLEKSLDDDLLP